MDWVQTLVIAAVPAVVTAAALLLQQRANSKAEVVRMRIELEHADSRAERDEARRAHLEILAGARDYESTLQQLLDQYDLIRMPVASFRTPERDAAADAALARITRGMDTVRLSSSLHAAKACGHFLSAMGELEGRLYDAETSDSVLNIAKARMDEMYSEYVGAARNEVGLT